MSFYLDRGSAPARVGLGVTTVLTMVTLMGAVNRCISWSYIHHHDLISLFVLLTTWNIFLGPCQRYLTWRPWISTWPFAFLWFSEHSSSKIIYFYFQSLQMILILPKVRNCQLHGKEDKLAQTPFHRVQKEGGHVFIYRKSSCLKLIITISSCRH